MEGKDKEMKEKYSWKRTEEIEIDLADLLKRLCGKWKQAAACALAAALVFGAAGWLRSRSGPDESLVPGMDAPASLTQEEEQAVADAVQLAKETDSLENYLEQSLLMQADPYRKARYIMLYRIDRAERQELQAVTESYLNFVSNGGAADALAETGGRWDMDKSCIAELVQAYQKTYSAPYPVIIDEAFPDLFSESLFYIEMTGRNAREAERMALDMQKVLKEQAAEIKKAAGSHRLSLVSTAQNMTADSSLLSQQREKRALLTSNQTSLKAMTDAFSKEQLAAYKMQAGRKDEQEEDGKAASGADTEGSQLRSVVKYMILGLFGGMAAYAGLSVCWYLFCDTVKSVQEMKRLYAFPVFGALSPPGAGKAKKGRLRMGHDLYAAIPEQVCRRLVLACQKQEIRQLYAVTEFPLAQPEKDCLEHMAAQLRKEGVEMAVAENASADIAAWDSLREAGNVLLVCRTDTTTHQMIDDAMMFFEENGISVTGAVAFCG